MNVRKCGTILKFWPLSLGAPIRRPNQFWVITKKDDRTNVKKMWNCPQIWAPVFGGANPPSHSMLGNKKDR